MNSLQSAVSRKHSKRAALPLLLRASAWRRQAAGTGEEALHLGEGFDLLLGIEGKLCYSGVTLPEIRFKGMKMSLL